VASYVEALVATYSLMGLLIAQVLDCDGLSLVGRKNIVSVLFLNRIETWFCMKRIFLHNYRIENLYEKSLRKEIYPLVI
jgi:hypothetical protein